MNREKIARVLFMSAVLLVAIALVIVFCVVPGGATAEEVKDSYTIKTTAQWMLIVAGACGVVCYKMHSEEQ